MEITNLTHREKLQMAYELAFFPPRLSEFWRAIKHKMITDEVEIEEMIKMALLLHLALPESGYASVRALKRLARLQACSKAFVPETFLKNIAKYLNLNVVVKENRVPGSMIRDIGMPSFKHGVPSQRTSS